LSYLVIHHEVRCVQDVPQIQPKRTLCALQQKACAHRIEVAQPVQDRIRGRVRRDAHKVRVGRPLPRSAGLLAGRLHHRSSGTPQNRPLLRAGLPTPIVHHLLAVRLVTASNFFVTQMNRLRSTVCMCAMRSKTAVLAALPSSSSSRNRSVVKVAFCWQQCM
jgi:hypothetical protein